MHPKAVSRLSIDTHSSDATLFAAIGSAGPAARLAQEQLYARHVRYLYAVVQKRCRGFGLSSDESEDLVHDTFARAFAHAKSYRASLETDAELERRWTRAWLGQIARNLLLDCLEGRQALASPEELELLSVPAEELPPESDTPRLRALRAALGSLSEREQDVLRVSALYQRRGEAHQRLPNDVSEELARRWETTNDNIRAIRSRAMKKLEQTARALLDQEATT
ncbi:MAG TPA: sigma-70 family RNA polymerase sigma factor [Polyangiaceae bacterium]|nr:sigma-70 family RNA polymerase sigma factor [Polyangiaceae bacterium]